MGFFDVGSHQFDRLMALAIDITEHHAWLGHSQFVAFTTHVFQQNGQVQFTTTGDVKHAFFVGFFHTQSHVVLQFFLQTVPQLTAGHVFAFTAGQWAGVHAEVHGQCWLINLEHWQRCWVDRVSHRHADVQVSNTVDQHDVARAGFGSLHAVQTLELQHLVDATFDG
jgi:hypothetical protein